MNRIFVSLVVGIFLMVGVCLAAENRAAMDAGGASQAIITEVETAIKGLTETPAIEAKLQALKVGKTNAEQKQIDLAINSLHRNWVGVDYSPEIVTAVAKNAAKVSAVANPVTAETMQVITAKLGTVTKVPEVKVVPDEDMAGVIGPMLLVVENVVVVGQRDWRTMQALPSFWAHEFAEAVGAANGLTKEDAHAKAQAIEDTIRAKGVTDANQAEITAQIITDDAERLFNFLQAVSQRIQGVKIKIQTRDDFKDRDDWKAIVNIFKSGLGGDNIDVTYPLPNNGSKGTFNIEIADASGKPVNQALISAQGPDLYRLGGLLTEGLIAASIPTIQTGENVAAYTEKWQPTVNILKEQHKANTNGVDLVLPPNPNDWPAFFRQGILVQLPPIAVVNVNLQMEQEIARQIFGKMA